MLQRDFTFRLKCYLGAILPTLFIHGSDHNYREILTDGWAFSYFLTLLKVNVEVTEMLVSSPPNTTLQLVQNIAHVVHTCHGVVLIVNKAEQTNKRFCISTAELAVNYNLGPHHNFCCRGLISNPRPVLDSSAKTTRGMILDFLGKTPKRGFCVCFVTVF